MWRQYQRHAGRARFHLRHVVERLSRLVAIVLSKVLVRWIVSAGVLVVLEDVSWAAVANHRLVVRFGYDCNIRAFPLQSRAVVVVVALIAWDRCLGAVRFDAENVNFPAGNRHDLAIVLVHDF
eukprot:SAG31_NODE_9160_length_1324_cov_0.976327_2_plen_123_part_00